MLVFKCDSKATCWFCDGCCGSVEHVDGGLEKTHFCTRGFYFQWKVVDVCMVLKSTPNKAVLMTP